jgi:hypothetical protein
MMVPLESTCTNVMWFDLAPIYEITSNDNPECPSFTDLRSGPPARRRVVVVRLSWAQDRAARILFIIATV